MSKADNTKKFIVEKTAAVFNRKGYAGTSMSDLTEATGLTKGSIYGNFENKDAVALAVFDYNLAQLNSGVSRATANSITAIDKLKSMTSFYRAAYKTLVTAGGCPILNTAVEADDTHPRLKEKAAKSIRSWKKNIEGIVTEGIAAKTIQPGVNAGEFANVYIAMIEGGIMLSKVTGNSAMLRSCLNHAEKLIEEELKL